MGILTKFVDVHIGGRNINHFKEKGYKIPSVLHSWGETVPRGTVIKVKTEDLLPNCREYIDIQCDYCNKVLKEGFINTLLPIRVMKGYFTVKIVVQKRNFLAIKVLDGILIRQKKNVKMVEIIKNIIIL